MIFRFLKSTFLFVFITVTACGNTSSQQDQVMTPVATEGSPEEVKKELRLGAARFEEYLPLLAGKKVGLIGNQTSIIPTENGNVHLVDSLLSLDVDLRKVFAPEHGFRGTADAGELIKDGKDTQTGLPVISLYGNNKKPTSSQLQDLDILVFDLQDVGLRFYTYISTLHYVMEAAAENDLPVILLDRPNPNAHYIDGPVLEPQHKSFVGMHPVPVVYGMTIGEYAQMINGEKWLENGIETDLHVIRIENYDHQLEYDLPVKPSPNLPNARAINLYPSLCFFEGTNVNAGRGTDKQFQVFGSPFLPREKYDFQYTPQSNEGAKSPKHLGKTCYGKDLSSGPALDRINLEWLINAYRDTSEKSEFFNNFFTNLAGTENLSRQIEKGLSEETIRESWQPGLKAFNKIRVSYLLY
ncbi:exo-beta-N-acetylmuramidase NamZ family protein [Salinimicrobium flavum]|uniref:Exo-beta-N-acetylmuramidase NamZ domain-containing protein n=1 Tax=Salinimicrobium flavum TaxID=1737065 RepID=A0ABW5ISM6_9FLAO